MSQGMEDDITMNLKKIGPVHSSIDEKQQQYVQLIKRFEIQPQMQCAINKNIPGLTKKRVPFTVKPANS